MIPCRSCGRNLCEKGWYRRLNQIAALAISSAISYTLSARGWELGLATVALWIPSLVLWLAVFGHIVPIQLEECEPPDAGGDSGGRGMFR